MAYALSSTKSHRQLYPKGRLGQHVSVGSKAVEPIRREVRNGRHLRGAQVVDSGGEFNRPEGTDPRLAGLRHAPFAFRIPQAEREPRTKNQPNRFARGTKEDSADLVAAA